MDDTEKETTENKPDPMNIMKILISLYADQMGVNITCDIEAGGKCERFTTKKR